MYKLLTKSIAFMMVAIFMVNAAAWSFSTHRIAHNIEHSRQLPQGDATAINGNIHYDAAVNVDNDSATNGTEHKFLHAVDHLQYFPSTAFYGLSASVPKTVLGKILLCALPFASFDAPFRPPRSQVSST